MSDDKPKVNLNVVQNPGNGPTQAESKKALDALMQILYGEGVFGICIVIQGANGSRFDMLHGGVECMDWIKLALDTHSKSIDQALQAFRVMRELQAKEAKDLQPQGDPARTETDPKKMN